MSVRESRTTAQTEKLSEKNMQWWCVKPGNRCTSSIISISSKYLPTYLPAISPLLIFTVKCIPSKMLSNINITGNLLWLFIIHTTLRSVVAATLLYLAYKPFSRRWLWCYCCCCSGRDNREYLFVIFALHRLMHREEFKPNFLFANGRRRCCAVTSTVHNFMHMRIPETYTPHNARFHTRLE